MATTLDLAEQIKLQKDFQRQCQLDDRTQYTRVMSTGACYASARNSLGLWVDEALKGKSWFISDRARVLSLKEYHAQVLDQRTKTIMQSYILSLANQSECED